MTVETNLPPARSFVIVGHLCIDENTGTDAVDSSPLEVRRVAGSPAFFMNRQLQALDGVGVRIIAPYGDDFLAVDDTLPLLNGPTAGSTLLYRNHIDGDIRVQECFNAELAGPVPIVPEFARELQQSDIVVVCPLLPNFTPEYLDEVLAPVADPRRALKVLLVQGYVRTVEPNGSISKRAFAEYASVLPRFDLAVFSDEDIDDALAVAACWSVEFPQTTIVVTQNRDGATYFEAGIAANVPAQPLERQGVGSVVGAGDVFSAALAAGFESGRDIRRAVEQANSAAATFIDGARVAALSAS